MRVLFLKNSGLSTPAKPALRLRLSTMHNACPGLVDVNDRHAVQHTALVLPRGGVDVVRFRQHLVRHIGFGEQDVHVSGHTPGHGMDGIPDLAIVFPQQLSQFIDRVLGLATAMP